MSREEFDWTEFPAAFPSLLLPSRGSLSPASGGRGGAGGRWSMVGRLSRHCLHNGRRNSGDGFGRRSLFRTLQFAESSEQEQHRSIGLTGRAAQVHGSQRRLRCRCWGFRILLFGVVQTTPGWCQGDCGSRQRNALRRSRVRTIRRCGVLQQHGYRQRCR